MMNCRFDELPAPPPGKTGWPWTIDYIAKNADAENAEAWPRISIVTPSYNQGKFIEQTIRSVLLQGYPNLEYHIADGGSTDETLEIIRKYASWLSWSSGPDGGQVAALNRALPQTTGDILNWLNSDDFLMPGCLDVIARISMLNPKADMITGARLQRSATTGAEVVWVPWIDKWPLLTVGFAIYPQEATFFSRRVLNAVGGFDESLNYGFDGAFFANASSRAENIVLTAAPFAGFNVHSEQKSLRGDEKRQECERRLDKLYRANVPWFSKLAVRLCFTRWSVVADALLRCLIYRRAKRKFQIGEYDWQKNKWVLKPF